MKSKVKILSKSDARGWYMSANLLVQSIYPFPEAVKQFNELTATMRQTIRTCFSECDDVRRQQISKEEPALKEAWLTSIMVDAHIIATEYNIDPLTAALCVNPPCKPYEKVVVRLK